MEAEQPLVQNSRVGGGFVAKQNKPSTENIYSMFIAFSLLSPDSFDTAPYII